MSDKKTEAAVLDYIFDALMELPSQDRERIIKAICILMDIKHKP